MGALRDRLCRRGLGVASMPGCKCRTDGTLKVAEGQKQAEIPGFRGSYMMVTRGLKGQVTIWNDKGRVCLSFLSGGEP